jgi:ornithine decarboxylase
MSIATPYYLFDKAKFIKDIQAYQQIGEVYYPIKANDDDLVVNAAIESSCSFEVDSIEHIKKLITRKGVNAERLLYSYPIREKKDIRKACKLGVKTYVVDSIEEYEKIVSIASEVSFFVRLNVVDALNLNLEPQRNKWGLSISDAKDLINLIRNDGNAVVGISFYLFNDKFNESNYMDELWKNLLDKISDNFLGFNLKYLNIGGNIDSIKVNSMKDALEKTKQAIGAEKIIIEPGAPLLNPCINMIVSVIAVRTVNQKRIVFINSGIYSGLIDTIIKKKCFNIEHFDATKNTHLINKIEVEECLVCGSSSDVSDFLGEHSLSAKTKVGDKLVIKACGAYSTVMQTKFYKKNKIPMRIKGSS